MPMRRQSHVHGNVVHSLPKLESPRVQSTGRTVDVPVRNGNTQQQRQASDLHVEQRKSGTNTVTPSVPSLRIGTRGPVTAGSEGTHAPRAWVPWGAAEGSRELAAGTGLGLIWDRGWRSTVKMY